MLETYRDAVDALLMSGQWRAAGLEFLDKVRDARDLGHWVIGSYRQATSHVFRVDWPAVDASAVDEATIDAILTSARADVLLALREAAWGNGPGFVKDALASSAIVPTVDGFWIPLDVPRMRLKDRVLALFAADYLLSPRDYTRDLTICARCARVIFDPAARQSRHCGAHRISGFLNAMERRRMTA
jgi:hypothetical protein